MMRLTIEDTCIDCGLCAELAPQNIRMAPQRESAHVYRQPRTPDEERQCLAARADCPVDAIRVT